MRSTSYLCSTLLVLCVASGCNNATIGGESDGGLDEDMSQSGVYFDRVPGDAADPGHDRQQTPTVTYSATLSMVSPARRSGASIAATSATANAGPSSTTLFSPRGSAGGLVTLRATCSGQSLTRQILVNHGSQNGVNTSIPAEANQEDQVGRRPDRWGRRGRCRWRRTRRRSDRSRHPDRAQSPTSNGRSPEPDLSVSL